MHSSINESNEKTLQNLEEERESVQKLRIQLAKKNRAIASLQRQLDQVPGRAELAQYQRRFLELYNQGLDYYILITNNVFYQKFFYLF